MASELQFRIALSMTPRVDAQVVRRMYERGVSLEDFFNLPSRDLGAALGITKLFTQSERDEAMLRAAAEEKFCLQHSIKVLTLGYDGYPNRLSQCYDAPVGLYMLGKCDLEAEHVMAVVGTRRPTNYGVNFSNQLVQDLASWFPDDLLVVSGLAYGIDASAHRAALAKGVPTVAVVAHGLHTIYPAQHRNLAKEILSKGGAIISEYPNGASPYRGNFLARNRIVAGLSDAVVVAESAIRGGAMSTANMAFEYDREVFALPGRSTDLTSAGCNDLIRRDKAHLCTDSSDFVKAMGWRHGEMGVVVEQPGLFNVSDEQRPIYELLSRNSRSMTPDEIHSALAIPMSELLAILTDMEFDGVVTKSAGNRYSV